MPNSFFNPNEQQVLIEAIREAESKTNGEIRLHLQETCPEDPYETAAAWFAQLNMHQTKDRNGVLIFISYQDHKLAILGDTGIHEKVGANFWQAEKDLMIEHFKRQDYLTGLKLAIHDVGEKLSMFFPKTNQNPNELPNDLSFGNKKEDPDA